MKTVESNMLPPTLKQLLDRANATFDAMSPEDQKAMRRQQAISFVYGQLACRRSGQLARETVVELFDARDELLRSQGVEP